MININQNKNEFNLNISRILDKYTENFKKSQDINLDFKNVWFIEYAISTLVRVTYWRAPMMCLYLVRLNRISPSNSYRFHHLIIST
jgi:hypothetical protein